MRSGQLHAQATDANVEIDFDRISGLPPVRGDEAKLAQILINVVSNAIKFTSGGGRIVISAERTKPGGVAVHVLDSGVGMSEEEIEIALRPFGQVDGSRSRWREGTGLGLPIARALTELHGGALEIDSRPGEGTEVTIILPAAHLVSVAASGHDENWSGI